MSDDCLSEERQSNMAMYAVPKKTTYIVSARGFEELNNKRLPKEAVEKREAHVRYLEEHCIRSGRNDMKVHPHND